MVCFFFSIALEVHWPLQTAFLKSAVVILKDGMVHFCMTGFQKTFIPVLRRLVLYKVVRFFICR